MSHTSDCTHTEARGQSAGVGSPSTMKVLEIKLRLLGRAANDISPAAVCSGHSQTNSPVLGLQMSYHAQSHFLQKETLNVVTSSYIFLRNSKSSVRL